MSGLIIFRGALAPRQVDFTIAGGQTTTRSREVNLTVSSYDFVSGANNVTDLKVWCDLQSESNRFIAPLEADADWFRFAPSIPIVLSAGAGTKTITVQVRNAAMLTTDEIERSITLLDGDPHVSIMWMSDRRTIRSSVVGRMFSAAWSCSHDFDGFEVWTVNSLSSERGDGTLLIAGGAGAAGEVKLTEVDQNDFLALNGAGVRMGKVFVSVGGSWYS